MSTHVAFAMYVWTFSINMGWNQILLQVAAILLPALLHLKRQTISVNLPMPGTCWGLEKYNEWSMSDGAQTHWRMDQDYCGVKWNISVAK